MREFELPEGWYEVPLGDIANWGSGGTPSRKNESFYQGSIPWIKTGELGPRYIYDSEEKISADAIQNSSAKIFPKGSIAIAMYGATIGKTSIFGIDAATNQACAVAYPYESILFKNFLYYLFLNEKDAFIAKGKGGAQPNISQAIIKDHVIPLPPLAEQHEIAARLDTLLAQVDAAKARLDGIPALLKRFRQSVLAAAVSGKLTEGWRKEKSNSQPLFKLSTAFEIDDFGHELNEIPDTWKWTALGNYAKCSRGRFSIRPRNDPTCFGGSYPFIQIGDLPKNGGFISSYHQTLNEKGFAVSKMFSEGTIVIAIVGATIGNTGILNQSMCFPDSLVGIETNNPISNQFIDFYLRSEKQKIRTISYAGGGQPNIKLETLNQYPIPLPPLEEQAEIVTRVEALFAFADQIEARVKAAQAQVNQLTQAILAKAFRGELTAAWRAQHPELISGENSAEALLARIQAERSQSDKPAKKGGKPAKKIRPPKSEAPQDAGGDDLPAGLLNLPGLVLPEVVEAGRSPLEIKFKASNQGGQRIVYNSYQSERFTIDSRERV